MAFKTAAVSVTTTATLLTTFTDDGENGYGAILYNAGAVPVYVGGSAVTTAIGIPLAAGATMSLDLAGGHDSDWAYGIVATGTCEVRVGSLGVS